jgi:hypothetical protein
MMEELGLWRFSDAGASAYGSLLRKLLFPTDAPSALKQATK